MSSIPVDITGIIQKKFWEAKKNYEKAKKSGNIKKAQIEAKKCSKYLRLLAEEIPFEKQRYQEIASKYDLEANRLQGVIEIPPVKRSLSAQSLEGDSEIRRMDEEFENEVRTLVTKANLTWDDIAGLDDVKRLLREIVFFSMAKPEKPVKLSPPRRILLYGPPGNGKTMLAMAASSNLGATFFNVSIDRLLSRYVGDSPRLVSAMFRVATKEAPSTIFIDEIEVLVGRREEMRNSATGVVQTFLTELDGFASKLSDSVVLVMVATNKPWMIDEAILSRFEKRIYVPSLDEKARERIFQLNLEEKGFTIKVDFKELSELTEGLSGRDIMIACESAKMSMLRRANPKAHELVGGDAKLLASVKYQILPIKREEILNAISNTKPIITTDMIKKYEGWRRKYGIE